jgi:hypothetical protein
MEYSD